MEEDGETIEARRVAFGQFVEKIEFDPQPAPALSTFGSGFPGRSSSSTAIRGIDGVPTASRRKTRHQVRKESLSKRVSAPDYRTSCAPARVLREPLLLLSAASGRSLRAGRCGSRRGDCLRSRSALRIVCLTGVAAPMTMHWHAIKERRNERDDHMTSARMTRKRYLTKSSLLAGEAWGPANCGAFLVEPTVNG
jgi:hypothetical protein